MPEQNPDSCSGEEAGDGAFIGTEDNASKWYNVGVDMF